MSGWVKIYRKVLDNPRFRNDAEAMAFAWLVVRAQWKDSTVRYKGRTLNLKRGQVAISYRDFAERWDWSEPKCRRFVARLAEAQPKSTRSETDALVVAVSDAGVNVISICNYDKYQSFDEDGDAVHDALDDAGVTQYRRSTDAQNKEEKNIRKKESTPKPPRGQQGYSPEFESAWKLYPARQGGNPKGSAWKAWKQRLRDGYTVEQMTDGIIRYAAHIRSTDKEGSPYVKQMASFLGKEDPPHFMANWGGDSSTSGTPNLSDDDWRRNVGLFAEKSLWRPLTCGSAKPGEPGCLAPEHILSEFGYGPATLFPIDQRRRA
jgi:hypothetical protein